MTASTEKRPGQIVFTNKARCRDCNRCVRVCPVKAIRITDGQAFVEDDLCIACGTCIRECPQGAKTFRNDVERASRILSGCGTVAASVAPSFPAVFNTWEQKRLASALRRLGFSYVTETAIGAAEVAKYSAELMERLPDTCSVSSACPAVVVYLEKYRPDDVSLLTPVVSPMIAHARLLKKRLGRDAKVVFIGPCVTKKAEAERSGYEGIVDCVLTFQELREWFGCAGIDIDACEESGFDEQCPSQARLYPLEGGGMKTAGHDGDILDRRTIFVTGVDHIDDAVDFAAAGREPVTVEPLFCPHGCINGPGMDQCRSVFDRRLDVLSYAASETVDDLPAPVPVDLSTRFKSDAPVKAKEVTEVQIQAVFERTGQVNEEDQLNCGACGYTSCRARAIAVVRGLAEIEMCLPYMRRQAEQRSDRIMETSPNGIIILDERLEILTMNPAFRRFFSCSEAVCGKHISYLMDPEPFTRLESGEEDRVELEINHERYNIICHEILYALPEAHQFVGIFINVTHMRRGQETLERLREQTILQAQELIDHQVTMAQTIAKFLGQSTAQGEALVENLLKIAGERPEKVNQIVNGKPFTPWHTNT